MRTADPNLAASDLATRTSTKTERHYVSAARVLLLIVACAACLAGFLLGAEPAATRALAEADPSLAGLVRAMAVLKMAMAVATTAAVLWRLGAKAGLGWIGAYALACAAMWAGPGLIWNMVHVRLGALSLHGGLLATLALLWRDPTVGTRLAGIVAGRREAIRARRPR